MNLRLPPASVTDRSAAVIWDGFGALFPVLLNREYQGEASHGDYTFENLSPDTEYEAQVGNERVSFKTLPDKKALSIVDFGALGDGETLNTKAIQAGIDALEKGGRLVVPKGVFVTGALFLKSHMILSLEQGAVLLGSSETKDYPPFTYRWEGREQLCYASLINTPQGEEVEDIAIEGQGTLDANGVALFENEMAEKKAMRGRAICIRNADGVYLKDITVKKSPAWCVHMIYSKNITLNNIKIHTKYGHIFNGDGFDPDSCQNVTVFHSMIMSQDDCIAIKSGRDEEGRRVGIPTENVRITNCDFNSGFGVVVGSEMSGSVRNVYVGDCRFHNAYSVCSLKGPRGRGGVIENVMYENCTFLNESTEHTDCKWFRGAIMMDHFYSHEDFDPDEEEPFGEDTPKIRNVVIRNIVAETVAGNAIFLCGLPESKIENITLENICAKGKFGMKAMNVDGLLMKNVQVTAASGEPYFFNNVKEIG